MIFNYEWLCIAAKYSRVMGTSEIKDFELEFRGVATIVPKKGETVPILIWELDDRDLPTLNKYEGYPSFYRQEKLPFEMGGKSYEGMAYLMNRGTISPPSQRYYNTILQGYRERRNNNSDFRKYLWIKKCKTDTPVGSE